MIVWIIRINFHIIFSSLKIFLLVMKWVQLIRSCLKTTLYIWQFINFIWYINLFFHCTEMFNKTSKSNLRFLRKILNSLCSGIQIWMISGALKTEKQSMIYNYKCCFETTSTYQYSYFLDYLTNKTFLKFRFQYKKL